MAAVAVAVVAVAVGYQHVADPVCTGHTTRRLAVDNSLVVGNAVAVVEEQVAAVLDLDLSNQTWRFDQLGLVDQLVLVEPEFGFEHQGSLAIEGCHILAFGNQRYHYHQDQELVAVG